MPNDTTPEGSKMLTGTLAHAAGDAAAVIDVAEDAVAVTERITELDAAKLYAVRQDEGRIETLDLEKFRDNPARQRGVYRPATVDDFVAYVGEWCSDSTSVWIDPEKAKVVALLDDGDHGSNTFGWKQHRAIVDLIVTPEWEFWKKDSGEWLGQFDFAEKLEDGMSDIREPAAAQLLEIAKTLHVKTAIKFKSGVNLTNQGVKLQYEEEVEEGAGEKGDITIPETFKIAIAPYVGEAAFIMTARLRYRPQGGKLAIGYKLMEAERAERTILEEIAKRIREGLGTRVGGVYLGSPPA
jgi:uncharacterized protein YfdQ (DUF2303 family)